MSKSVDKVSLEKIDFNPFSSPHSNAPSTEAQREIFSSVKLGGDAANRAYNESVTIHLKGALNRSFLKAAFEDVIKRHDGLRCTFSADGTEIIFSDNISTPWEEIDADLDMPADLFLDKHTKEATLHAFDLEKGPLIRTKLIRYHENDHALIITGHHIICDGWSLSMLIRDMGDFYSARVRNTAPDLEPALSFAAYAKSQAEAQQKQDSLETETFWLKQYEQEVPVVEFPVDYQRPALRSFHAKRIDVTVPPQTVKALRDLGKKNNTSFVTTFLAAFEAFLYRITGQEVLVTGLPASGQSIEGLYNLVGHCVNLLPLKSHVQPRQPFLDYLKSRKEYMFDAFDHQQFTFGSLITKLNFQRDPSRIPLVPVVINVDIGFTDGLQFEGCTFELTTNPRFFENFEVFLNATGKDDKLVLECTYNNDLFDTDMMRLRMEEFIRIMNSIVEHPAQQIGQLELLTDEEKKFFAEINNTSQNYDTPLGIHECIDRMAGLVDPGEIAVVFGDEHLTYPGLREATDRMAALLQSQGIRPGDRVAVCIPRDLQLPVVLIGIMKAGGVYVPLDRAFPHDRLHYMAEDSGATHIITTRELQAEFGFKVPRILYQEDFKGLYNGQAYTPVPVTRDSIVYVLYTSGSTGKPKGVVVRHRGITNLFQYMAPTMGMRRGDRILAISTISFDVSVLELFMPLMHGACLHVGTREKAMDPAWMTDYIDRNKIRYLQATPATYDFMFAGGWKGNKELIILIGGEGLRKELAERLLATNKEIWNLYGPTEISIWATMALVNFDTLSKVRNGIHRIGKPVANSQVYVMDVNGQPCPIGVAGELWIAGEGVSAGYMNRPDLTAEKFVPSPGGEGLAYRSGDRVLMDKEGELYFLNRFDDQVKIRSFRIELGEIETVLNSCEGIEKGIVMAIPDKNGEKKLAAWFTLANKAWSEEQAIHAFRKVLSAQLPEYMIPTAWRMMEVFPLTATGKVNKKALPEPEITSTAAGYDNPGADSEALTREQEIIKKLWETVLKVPNVRLDDNFFELGGHSILAVKIMVELEKETGIKLPLAVLFTSPTVRLLSKLYEKPAEEALWNPIVPFRDSGRKPPLYFAHGISGNVFKYYGLSQLTDNEQPCYGLQAYGLNGKDTPFHDMKEMAAYHIRSILEFQPKGPYLLAGGSFGGYLAYEMAAQLQEMGHHVPFVCLFDIDAGKRKEFLPQGLKQIVDAQLFAERVMKRAIDLAMADQEERKRYFDARKRQSQQKTDIESWLDKHKVVEMIGEESAAYFKRVEDACYNALYNYKIRPYKGDVLLIRAKDSFFNNEYDYDLGWSHYVQGTLSVETVPGDHNSIFWDPHLEGMSVVFRRYLEKVNP